MKYLLLLIVLWIPTQNHGQEFDTIPWAKERKLTWSDFKGKPRAGSRAAAVTASGITYSFSSLARGNAVEVDFTVNAFFYPNKSWYHAHLCDSLILSHEQLHFDISELFARKLKKRLDEITYSLNIKTEVRAIYKDILRELDDFQNLYDVETNFSRNRESQLLWNEKIREQLQQ